MLESMPLRIVTALRSCLCRYDGVYVMERRCCGGGRVDADVEWMLMPNSVKVDAMLM
jgi:hypothetical protein